MSTVMQLIVWEVAALLLGLFAVVVIQLLDGTIHTRGLLLSKDGTVSAARVQLLLATIAAAYEYLSQLMKNPAQFPQVHADWLTIYGGSHAIYLGRKIYSTWTARKA